MINAVGDRFERRLVEETSKLRVEMAQGFGAMRGDITGLRHELRQEMAAGFSDGRQEMAAGLSDVRREMAAGFSDVRQEMAAGFSGLRQEMAAGFSGLRQDMSDQRFDILKWVFLFWVGQFFAVASLIALLSRFMRLQV